MKSETAAPAFRNSGLDTTSKIVLRAAYRQSRAHPFFHSRAGANGNGGLANHQAVARHVLGDRFRHRKNLCRVGRSVTPRGSAHGNKLRISMLHGFAYVRRETQAAIREVSANEVFKSRFMDVQFALGELPNGPGVDVETHDTHARFGETGAGNQPHIAAAVNGDFHGRFILGALWLRQGCGACSRTGRKRLLWAKGSGL